jgi:hypothetical protein
MEVLKSKLSHAAIVLYYEGSTREGGVGAEKVQSGVGGDANVLEGCEGARVGLDMLSDHAQLESSMLFAPPALPDVPVHDNVRASRFFYVEMTGSEIVVDMTGSAYHMIIQVSHSC